MGDGHAAGLRGVAEPREPRVLPRLEREAITAGGTRAVRLRERELHVEPLGLGGLHLVLRRPARAACRPFERRGVLRLDVVRYPWPGDDAGTPRSAGHAV